MGFSTKNFVAFISLVMLMIISLCLSIVFYSPTKIDLQNNAKQIEGKITSLIFNETNVQFTLDDNFAEAFSKTLSNEDLQKLQAKINKGSDVKVYYKPVISENSMLPIIQLEKAKEILVSKNLIEQENTRTRNFTLGLGTIGLFFCSVLLFGKLQLAKILKREDPHDGIAFPALFVKKNMAMACYTEAYLMADRRLGKQVYQNSEFIDSNGKRHFVDRAIEDSKLLLLPSLQKIGAMVKYKPIYKKSPEPISFEELKAIVENELSDNRKERHGKIKEEYTQAIREAKDIKDLIMVLH